jgi:hypothetical protein
MGSLRGIVNLGNFLHAAVAPWVVLGLLSSAMAGDHKQKVWVPVTPVYTVPTSGVAMAPVGSYSVATYSAGTVAGAPLAAAPMSMAPVNGGFGGVYYTTTAVGGTQVSMAPTTYVYPTTANAPQVVTNGVANAPTGFFPGNIPPGVGDSRVTAEGRKDVYEDLRDYYRETKTNERSRTALRKALKDQAAEKYVEVIGGDVASPDDLKDSERREIDGIVDMVMREDASNANAPSGSPGGPVYGYGYAPQPMMYYYVYPVAPVGHHSHPHHVRRLVP